MKLLDLKTVKVEKAKGVIEQTDRIVKLRDAETTATKELNVTREFVEKEKQLLNDELSDHTKKVITKKNELTREVTTLESRRSDALKPITQQKKEADERILLADEKEKDIEIREKDLSEKNSELVDRIGILSDAEQDLIERKSDFNKREQKVKSQEEFNKESTKKLNNLWVKYHKKINESNIDLERREKEINDKIEVDKSLMSTIEKEKLIIIEDKRAVVDLYQALEQAKKHLGIKS